MPVTYVFVDFENVKPDGLALLNSQPAYHVLVLVGAMQDKVSVDDLVLPLLEMGDRGKIIKVTGKGPNALDFHIAFTLGQLEERTKESCFRIISKDKGFDPLIDHLKSLGRDVARHDSIQMMLGIVPSDGGVAKKPASAKASTSHQPKTLAAKSTNPSEAAHKKAKAKPARPVKPVTKGISSSQLCETYFSALSKPRSTRPGTVARLKNDVCSKSQGATKKHAEDVVALLIERELITVDCAGRVTYHLNAQETTKPREKNLQELCRTIIDKLDTLKNPKATHPRSKTALSSFIKSTYPQQQLTDVDIEAMIRAMHDKEFITVNSGGSITWPAKRQASRPT